MAKINEQAVRKIADSYSDWALELGLDLSLEDIQRAIISAAHQASGCANCIYSTAPRITSTTQYRSNLPIMARGCVLGLSQTGCTARKPIIE